jgi:hypothetical protein
MEIQDTISSPSLLTSKPFMKSTSRAAHNRQAPSLPSVEDGSENQSNGGFLRSFVLICLVLSVVMCAAIKIFIEGDKDVDDASSPEVISECPALPVSTSYLALWKNEGNGS